MKESEKGYFAEKWRGRGGMNGYREESVNNEC